jgi:hypothetical protein
MVFPERPRERAKLIYLRTAYLQTLDRRLHMTISPWVPLELGGHVAFDGCTSSRPEAAQSMIPLERFGQGLPY